MSQDGAVVCESFFGISFALIWLEFYQFLLNQLSEFFEALI